MSNMEEIKKDLIEQAKKRNKSGRLLAHVILNYDEWEDIPNYDIIEELDLRPTSFPEVAKAKATAKQLKEMGWCLQKL